VFWSIIKLVHSKFLVPYFQLFELTLKPLLATPDPLLAQTMAVLVDLYYDLTCQDLAPEFEDRHESFFAEGTGYFMQLMAWDPPQLQTDVRRRCFLPQVPFTPLTRYELLSARGTNAVPTL
jgi:exportin-2 (importin alpha re-exporter)